MILRDRLNETICSISTPQGVGGISVIRVSGSNAVDIVGRSIKNTSELNISHKAFFSKFFNSQSKELIDEVIITSFLDGKSYTGEDTVEISCHGSPIICELVIKDLCNNGCKVAERGEFTFRAFSNGKIDLVQAESVYSLIHSQSQSALRLSLGLLTGKLSENLKLVESDILWCLAHIEAGIDFSTEDIVIIEDKILISKLDMIASLMTKLLESFERSKVHRDGVHVVLSGFPNVGKSSIMNLLLDDERSIVSPIEGTTRDLVRESIVLDGCKIILSDTAGIRNLTNDPIEKKGIEKSLKAQMSAAINLLILDLTNFTDFEFILENYFKLIDNDNDAESSTWSRISDNVSESFVHSTFSRFRDFIESQLMLVKNLDLNSVYILVNKYDLYVFKDKNFENIFRFYLQSTLIGILTKVVEFNRDIYRDEIYFKNLIFDIVNHRTFFVSTFAEDSKKRILNVISNDLKRRFSLYDDLFLNSIRQYTDIIESKQYIKNAISTLKQGIGNEFIAFELQQALLCIQKVLGIVYDDQVIDKIFKEFCLGK